ncbi:PIG-L family deacetylase [Salinimicrobium sp. MT39]|uniref:PIG-L family deacetylase n=1 Tax=Salinimicrobium profundisediminis TaxID=2994553 RepID=A0A9X3I260_9FLAO|nr:PIG-L family deacetylase [Salinimicrobium profundisediminis]MCX2839299.1 PIG-L family deacetylase [Salinimicrobium profundisediminis]
MRKLFCLVFLFISGLAQAQQPEKLNSSEIYSEIEKLNFLGSVLYVAAHPDDENTRLISYFSNELNARTAYLSLTRGDGGQNLIGPQLRELLGVIRTQELLAARKIDGGEQFFSRANDFGYSKTPEETLNIWNEEEVLKDVVRTIRLFKPDVIINRFDANSAGETHGHHTSSAILSSRAFDLAGKPSAYPQLADELGTWQPKKLFFNTSPWFYESQEAFDAADKSRFISFDTGVYFPLKGLSNTEIASLSRSQHQSQGFGSTGTRGTASEYIELLKGKHPENNPDIFHGINTSWSRVKGGKEIGKILNLVQENFDFKDPAASVPQLVKAYQLIQNLEDPQWKELKSEQIKDVIAAAMGLYLEAVAGSPLATPGEKVNLELEAINRSDINTELLSVKLFPEEKTIPVNLSLANNRASVQEIDFVIPENINFTSPYWLNEEGSLGMYRVTQNELIGLPETPRELKVQFTVDVAGVKIPFERNITYKFNDPVTGESYRPFEVVPKVSVTTGTNVMVFANGVPGSITVTVKAMANGISGELNPEEMPGWKISPEKHIFDTLQKGEEITFSFEVQPPAVQDKVVFKPVATVNGNTYSRSVVQLDYPHIPLQTLVLPNKTSLVKLDIQKRGNLVGYIQGAGDVVPQALEQMGYKVELIDPKYISENNLAKFDAVVVGIRAYNTIDELRYRQPALFEYVKQGGNLILQYNTSRGLVTETLAPYELELSRDRVTNEAAEVTFLAPNHPVLNFPNKITSKDFEGWVQERGLYFPDKWGKEFTPILAMNDKDEAPTKGSLLVTPYGKGNFIYTGLSFFREFPAGVPGAFRLFANMLSLPQHEPSVSGLQQDNQK